MALDPETGRSTQIDYPGEEQIAFGFVLGPDGNFYLGTYPTGLFIRYSPATRRFETLGRPAKTETYLYSLAVGKDGRIYAGTYPGAHLVAVDPRTGRLEDFGSLDHENTTASRVAVGPDGSVYVGIGFARANLVRFDPATRRAVSVLPEALRVPSAVPLLVTGEDGQVYATIAGKRFRVAGGESVVPVERVPAAPLKAQGWQLARFTRPGELVVREEQQRTKHLQFTYSGATTRIWSMASTPDGELYGGTVFPPALFRWDLSSGRSHVVPLPAPPEGQGEIEQVEIILPVGRQLMVLAYPNAWLLRYERGDDPKIELLGKLGPGHYRPRAGVIVGDAAYMTGWPEFGRLSGAIAEIELASWKVRRSYEEVVPKMGINALCWDGGSGLILGGTTIHGAGVKPERKEAVVFGWDPKRGRKAYEVVPAPDGQDVSSLLCTGGKAVGVEQKTRTVFVIDAATGRVLHRSQVEFGRAKRTGKLGAADLLGRHAILAAGAVLYAVDPATLTVTKLLEHEDRINMGPVVIGRVAYFSSGATLYRVDLTAYERSRR